MAKLGDICLLITDGSHFSPADNENGYPMLSVKDMGENDFSFDDCKHISEEDYEILVKQGCKPEVNDVLLAKDGSYFRYAFVVKESREIAVLSSIAIIRPNQSMVNSDYLRFFLLHEKTYQTVSLNYITGTALKRVILKGIKKIDVPLPDLETQRQIAANLDKVTHTIDLCNAILEKLDMLVKARFVEMFGNPVLGDVIKTNRHKIGDFASVTKLAGFEFTKYIKYKESGDIIMLRGLNCKNGKLVLDNIKWIDKETSDLLPRSKLFYGDILMTYAGTIGDVAMVDANNKYHLAPNVGKITIEDKGNYNPIYLIHLFMYSHDYIMTFASQVAQASINMEKIRNFEYYFPAIEQQEQFAAFVEQTDKSKSAVKQVLEKAETLKKALMQEYFG